MAAAHPQETKTEPLNQIGKIGKGNILQMTASQTLQKEFSVHHQC